MPRARGTAGTAPEGRSVEDTAEVSDELEAKLVSLLEKKVVLTSELIISPSFADDHTIYGAVYPFGVVRSRDEGRTFEMLWHSNGDRVFSLRTSPSFASDRTLFVSTATGFYRSLDGGETWVAIGEAKKLRKAVVAISPGYADDGTVFVGGSLGLFVSRDHCVSWHRLNVGGKKVKEPINGLALSPNFVEDRLALIQVCRGNLYVGTDGPKGFSAVVSDASAQGFEPIQTTRGLSPLIRFSPHFAVDRTIFAASGDHVLQSKDGGLTWRSLSRPFLYEAEGVLSPYIASAFESDGAWRTVSGPQYSSSGALVSMERGASLSLRFDGRSLKVLGAVGPDQGTATVFIDGEKRTTIDQYAATRVALVESFAVEDMVPGPHIVDVVVEGARHPDSTGTFVTVDAMVVHR